MSRSRFLTAAALAALAIGWVTSAAQAGPFRYRGHHDQWHGSYSAAPAYGSYYGPAYGSAYVYPAGGYYAAPVVTPSYYAPGYLPGAYGSGFGAYPAGGFYYGSGYGGYYHHHH